MRFQVGFLTGLAVGYYFGAKAGRQRYHQIEEVLDRVRTSTLGTEVRQRAAQSLPLSLQRALGGRGQFDDDTEVMDRFGDPTFN